MGDVNLEIKIKNIEEKLENVDIKVDGNTINKNASGEIEVAPELVNKIVPIANEWIEAGTYQAGAYVIYKGLLYKSRVTNTGANPEYSRDEWDLVVLVNELSSGGSSLKKKTITVTTDNNGDCYIPTLLGFTMDNVVSIAPNSAFYILNWQQDGGSKSYVLTTSSIRQATNQSYTAVVWYI